MYSNKTVYLFRRAVVCLFILTYLHNSVSAQSKKVILVGFYVGNYNDGTTVNTTATQGVPCPLDPNSLPNTNTWFYDRLAQQANTIASSGFTAVWSRPWQRARWAFPGPANKLVFHGGGIYDSGYGVFDHYDLGDKLQKGNYQTRYGSRTQLTRCVAHASCQWFGCL